MNKHKNNIFRECAFVCMIGSFLFFQIISCGSGDSSSSGSSGVTSIDQLPRATSPVKSSASTSMSSLGSNSVSRLNASSGSSSMHLGTLSSSTFNSHSSIAACEMSNKIREAIRHAAKGDRIQCYVAQVVKDNPNISVDPYDGNSHVFALNFSGSSGGGPNKVKMTIQRDSSGKITHFEMAACGGGGNGSSNTQDEYLLQTIQASDFSMVSKEKHAGDQQDDSTGGEAMRVTGTLNSSGAFINTKTMDISYKFQSNKWGIGQSKATLQQTSDTISYSGFEGGSFISQNGSGSFSDRIYAIAGLESPSDANTLDYTILGGAAHAIISGHQGSDTWSDDRKQGWASDTTVDPNSSFLAQLTQDPPAVTSVDDVNFTGNEVFDCSSASDATVNVDESSLQTACAKLELDDHGYVNCWEIIKPQN